MDFKQKLNDFFDNLSPDFTNVAIMVVLCLLLFGAGNFVGSLCNVSVSDTQAVVQQTEGTEATQPAAPETTQATTAAPITQAPTTQAPVADTSAPAPSDSAAPATSAPAAAAPSGAPTTTAEILALFNESANRIKGEATKVVKNFENRTHNEEKLVIHPSIQGLANSLMAKYFQNDTTPIEYATAEDIVANYQVPGETWVSQLTEAEVSSATCTDNGTEYEITLNLITSQNPENGIGVSKGVDTITSSQIMENAPDMVKSFETEYADCVIKCKIDKATGRTTWSSYTTPVLLKLALDIPLVGAFDAQVGMTFEKDYTITY